MATAKPITKAQRDVIIAHLSDPKVVTQAEAMKRLRIKSYNNFYRLAYFVARTNK